MHKDILARDEGKQTFDNLIIKDQTYGPTPTGFGPQQQPPVTDFKILDSGDRREFETGAVRDRAIGKGKPTLISPHAITGICGNMTSSYYTAIINAYALLNGYKFQHIVDIYECILRESGLSATDAIRRLAVHMEKGAAKYSARNWEKGMPLTEFLDSLIRHLLALLDGKTDEDHVAAALFNIMGFQHTYYGIASCKLPSTLNDLPVTDEKS